MTRRSLLDRARRAAGALDEEWWRDCTQSEMVALENALKLEQEKGYDPEVEKDRLRARVDARRRLGLPHVDCTARKPSGCRCLDSALTSYQILAPGLVNVSKADVLGRSSKVHAERLELLKPKPKPRTMPTYRVPEHLPGASAPARGAAQAPPEPSKPKPEPRPRRKPQEAAHPLSWYAFKRSRDWPQNAADISIASSRKRATDEQH